MKKLTAVATFRNGAAVRSDEMAKNDLAIRV